MGDVLVTVAAGLIGLALGVLATAVGMLRKGIRRLLWQWTGLDLAELRPSANSRVRRSVWEVVARIEDVADQVGDRETVGGGAHEANAHLSAILRDLADQLKEAASDAGGTNKTEGIEGVGPIVRPPRVGMPRPYRGFTSVDVLYATDRAPTNNVGPSGRFTGNRGHMSYGHVAVSIPRHHRAGEIERPSPLLLEFTEEPSIHMALLKLTPIPKDEWLKLLDASVARTAAAAVLIFVHGYNVAFDESVRRAAQFAYDVNFRGIPVVFSWPSKGQAAGYVADEATEEWSSPHLAGLVESIVRLRRVQRVHLLAHSMGARVTAHALQRLNGKRKGKLKDLILAAPDIDQAVFAQEWERVLRRAAKRWTLYASSQDRAIMSSVAAHRWPRAGTGGDEILLLDGLDSIDVAPSDLDLLGHGYFAENKQVIDDLFMLLRFAAGASDRNLHPRARGNLTYYVFPLT